MATEGLWYFSRGRKSRQNFLHRLGFEPGGQWSSRWASFVPGPHVAAGHSGRKVHVYSCYFGWQDGCARAAAQVYQLFRVSTWYLTGTLPKLFLSSQACGMGERAYPLQTKARKISANWEIHLMALVCERTFLRRANLSPNDRISRGMMVCEWTNKVASRGCCKPRKLICQRLVSKMRDPCLPAPTADRLFIGRASTVWYARGLIHLL